MGGGDIRGVKNETVVALCDVDDRSLKSAAQLYPSAKLYKDYRIMLREMKDGIDAVTVSTPDHTHFPASMMAMFANKHVYVQKPMAHNIWQIRQMVAEARKRKLVTQMGNQGHTFTGIRLVREWIEAGLIGEVKEVIAWTDRPYQCYAFSPEQKQYPKATPVPGYLDWDLWQGCVKEPTAHAKDVFHRLYWRGWWRFGMGGLGDIGCHTLDTPFWALDLEIAHKVDVEVDHVNPVHTPPGSVVTYHCKQKKTGKVIPMTWYEGPKVPKLPAAMVGTKLHKEGGLIIIGSDGIVYHPGMRPDSPRLFPEEKWTAFRNNPESRPKEVYPRIKGGPIAEWLRAIKGEGPAPGSNFDYAGPLTEMIALGTLAIRTGKGMDYDAGKMQITNNPEAQAMIKEEAREGFRLEDLKV